MYDRQAGLKSPNSCESAREAISLLESWDNVAGGSPTPQIQHVGPHATEPKVIRADAKRDVTVATKPPNHAASYSINDLEPMVAAR